MRLVLNLYPVAISGYPTDPSKSEDASKRNNPPKRVVTGIIPDSDELINGLYTSANVFPPACVEFWCTDFISSKFRSACPVQISADVNARGERLAISVKELCFDNKWYNVNSTDTDSDISF